MFYAPFSFWFLRKFWNFALKFHFTVTLANFCVGEVPILFVHSFSKKKKKKIVHSYKWHRKCLLKCFLGIQFFQNLWLCVLLVRGCGFLLVWCCNFISILFYFIGLQRKKTTTMYLRGKGFYKETNFFFYVLVRTRV